MHRTCQNWLLGLVISRLILNYLINDNLKQRRQFISLVLLLLKFVEETGERLRPTLVHLDHLSLHVQQHVVDVIEVLFRKSLQNEKATRVVQNHAFVALKGKVANRAQKLRLIHGLEIHLGFGGLISRLHFCLGRVWLLSFVVTVRLWNNTLHKSDIVRIRCKMVYSNRFDERNATSKTEEKWWRSGGLRLI